MSQTTRGVSYFVGLDLGQASDFTALAVLERPCVAPDDPPARCRPAYALRHLHRFALGTPYPEVIQGVLKLLRTLHSSPTVLAVDQTGVGRVVVDMVFDGFLGKVNCKACRFTITDGSEITAGDRGGWYIPKKELVGTLQVLLQTRRLQIPRTLPDASILVSELENFRAKATLARNDLSESWRERPDDDMVLAVALAAWLGEMALAGVPAAERIQPATVLVP